MLTSVNVIGWSTTFVPHESKTEAAVPPVALHEYKPENDNGGASNPQHQYARGIAGNDVDEPTQLNAWRTIFRAHR